MGYITSNQISFIHTSTHQLETKTVIETEMILIRYSICNRSETEYPQGLITFKFNAVMLLGTRPASLSH